MTEHLKVVPLSEAPSLLDVAGQMRQLADAIERGEHRPEYALCVIVETDDFVPACFTWGRVPDRHGLAGLFAHLAQLALTDRERT